MQIRFFHILASWKILLNFHIPIFFQIKNVIYSNAQVTGSIANGLWSASMDNKFQESRDSFRVSRASSSGSHFSAGLKGLGMGVIGGLTSIITQPIEGASRKGVSVSATCFVVILMVNSEQKLITNISQFHFQYVQLCPKHSIPEYYIFEVQVRSEHQLVGKSCCMYIV